MSVVEVIYFKVVNTEQDHVSVSSILKDFQCLYGGEI
jgi:hypothetical protein